MYYCHRYLAREQVQNTAVQRRTIAIVALLHDLLQDQVLYPRRAQREGEAGRQVDPAGTHLRLQRSRATATAKSVYVVNGYC